MTVSDSARPPIPSAPSSPTPGGPARAGSGIVRPGADLGTRYHVEAALGEGGMGSVYRAYDRELDRRVAIKVIRPGLVADAAAVQRFKQELLLGSKVSHRNILRIHDLGDLDGLKFISMAFVDGEDLHGVLQREGAMEITRALKIARQIAEALAAAHAEGVVHRDLKPHNILLDRSGTAFVSDFGLAKSLAAADTGMTRSGELLGTPRYMAPEQVDGGVVDHRVDLYAFGLMLYEMVTGTVPFHGTSAIQELLLRVRTPAPDPRRVNAAVTGPLADVILRCLERDPAARYQSATEIVGALDGLSQAGTSSASGQASVAPSVPIDARPAKAWRRPWTRGRVLALAGVGAVVVAVAGSLLVWSRTAREPAPAQAVQGPKAAETGSTQPQERRFLAVLPFRVLGNEEQLRYIGDGLLEALSSRLFRLDRLHVASTRDVAQIGQVESIVQAGRKLGVNLVVEGTLQAAGNRLRVIVNLFDVAGGHRTWSQEFTGLREDLFALEDQIARDLVSALDPGASAAILAATSRPTDDIEAYDLYLKGRTALRERHDPKQIELAVSYFQQAIAKDTRFALAHAGLADASLLMYQEKKEGIWAERARAAAERARDLDDKLPEVHSALGSVLTATGRHAEAVVALTRGLQLAPDSDEGNRRLGAAYQALGKKDEALSAYARAVDVNPYFWRNQNVLGAAQRHFGDLDKALASFQRVTELEPDNPVGYENIGTVYFSQGRWEECVPAFEKALALQPYWLTYSNLGTAYFFLRKYPESVKAQEKATELNPNDATTLGNLADALRWSGQHERAREAYAKAITLAFQELQVNPRDATTLAMVALFHAKTGNAGRAQEFIRRARRADPSDTSLAYYEAVVHTLAGREAQALAALEKALAGGYPGREAAADPELEKLANSAEFTRLMQRYAEGPARPQAPAGPSAR